jgi:hypothetical protein
VRRRRFRALEPARSLLVTSAMRDIRLFILGHLMLVAVAVLGSI